MMMRCNGAWNLKMDQQKSTSKSKNTILKFATSSVSFQNPPIYSPTKDKRSSEKPHKSHLGIMVSIATGGRKIKNNQDDTVVYEPTSPRVSCMGQVKCKYTRAGNKPPAGKVLRLTSATPERIQTVEDDQQPASKTESKSKKKLGLKKLFGGVIITPGGGGRRKPDAGKITSKAPLYLDKAPSLSMMKRFSNGRDKLSDVDWSKEGAAVVSADRRYDSDEESDDEHVIVPSSAPVMIRNPLGFDDKFVRVAGNTEPRKEINLWKRRTMPQPKPLLLHNI
ncbi:hypothetical protein L1987_46293 [Smallanthus sonchifolius]|uniref:Uncharacterized protein n=1 Tax=Smallanthus sonchifolius TaxID=185202 RepID=A0ACB9G0C3_9ASTR|nr:hypothetical protein L1987_46293 [Smallanthus sonchifolius]